MAKKPAPKSVPVKSKSESDSASFTDTKRVKDLISLMAENGLTEIELVEDKSRIVLRRGTMTGSGSPASHQPMYASPPISQVQASSPPTAPAAPAKSADEGLIPIKSPMVGSFYTAANPDSDAYVSIGSTVDAKTTVCIIEAMKVFNEIHAEVSGTIAKVLVTNGQAVEYGQALFMVKPH